MLVGGTLAFSGSNYLFSTLRSSVKSASVTTKQSNSCRTEPLDWISEDLRRQGHAVQTFRDVDDAMREYSRITGTKLDPLGPEPKLSDIYMPSSGQRDRGIAFVILGMAATGLVAFNIAK